jgi:hypothetical protein
MLEPATDELFLSTLNAGPNVFRCDLATDNDVWQRIERLRLSDMFNDVTCVQHSPRSFMMPNMSFNAIS